MLRSGHAASITRSSLRYVSSSTSRTTATLARVHDLRPHVSNKLSLQKPLTLALALRKPLSTSLQRYATKPGTPYDHVDKKHEETVVHEKLEPNPEEVSTTSSVHQVFHEKGVEEEEKDEDMLAGVKADLVGRSGLHGEVSC